MFPRCSLSCQGGFINCSSGGFPGVGSLSPGGGSDSGSSSSNPSSSPSGSVKPPARFPDVGKQEQQQAQQTNWKPDGGAPNGGYSQPQRPSRGQGRQPQA